MSEIAKGKKQVEGTDFILFVGAFHIFNYQLESRRADLALKYEDYAFLSMLKIKRNQERKKYVFFFYRF